MQRIIWPELNLNLSKVAFGCAPVMGRVSQRQSLNAMSQAHDLGVTHFDVARSYGFGEAEKILGRFIANKRDKITIATKFGIQPSKLSTTARIAKPIVRAFRNAIPKLAAVTRRASGTMLKKGYYSLSDARKNIEISLSELNVDAIDLLFIHDCDHNDAVSGEVIHFLEGLVHAGKIRAWGIAAPIHEIHLVSAQLPSSPMVYQHAYQIDLNIGFQRTILHSPFGPVRDLFRVDRALPAHLVDWAKNNGFEIDQIERHIHGLVFESALTLNPDSVILCSMFDSKHIVENIGHVNSPKYSSELIASFTDYLLNNNEKTKI